MSQADELARRIVVLHRGAGFLRLELPEELCRPEVAQAVERGLPVTPGIAGATVDPDGRRISIRFDASTVSAGQVARTLFALLRQLPAAEAPEGSTAMALASGLQPLLDQLKAMLTPATAPAEGSLQARFQPLLESALTEKAIVNFFNDIVAFYLIKTHWDLITKRWLQNPVAHSNAWLTVFYLVFLLVRYRKSQ
jgi:hypothetical protein